MKYNVFQNSTQQLFLYYKLFFVHSNQTFKEILIEVYIYVYGTFLFITKNIQYRMYILHCMFLGHNKIALY